MEGDDEEFLSNILCNGEGVHVPDLGEKSIPITQDSNPVEEVQASQSSIMHSWLTIQLSVNKFCSCYEAILRRNQSGTTIQDKLNDAKKYYADLDKDKKPFALDHCWNILKGEDKWKAKMAELVELEKLAASKKKQKTTKVSRPRDEGAGNDVEVIAGDVGQTEPTRKRSDGIKKVKENLRRGGGEVCLEALEKMWSKKEAYDKVKEKAKEDRFLATLEIEKATLELEKKRVENEAKKSEADLMKEEK
ncbi:uncharacterized protein LOC110436437 [Sorghum bicolor]|uniref:uncharacterized protein LOC110436437 n=1 Tax=Sorghum bicolor TaxID=4558 RepID=UPI000B423DBE|nr:uncharacterized protein LOC110436437 [Sorghum bicolor]|eukprot:XP_021319211.1 uncharacterized protein LOC110436437 [Sorghum bicolor]